MVAFEGQRRFGKKLLAWALESGTIDGVVCVKDDPSDYSHPKAMLWWTQKKCWIAREVNIVPLGKSDSKPIAELM